MNALVIDVREYPEFQAGHIDGSKLVPLGTIDTCMMASVLGRMPWNSETERGA
jgi:hypothetical protein